MPRRMPRVSSVGLSLFLMAAGLAFATVVVTSSSSSSSSSLSTLNPWLTPNDLHQSNELRDFCSSSHITSAEKITSSVCPPPCPATVNNINFTQCLYYLKESHKEEVCGRDLGIERRRETLHGLRMRHCCEHAVDEALPEIAFKGGDTCKQMLDELLMLDYLAGQAACTHADLLSRYDCGQTYSIVNTCERCTESYRKWTCSTYLPRINRNGRLLRPCISICQDVEQQCPYLIPGDWTNLTMIPGEPTAHPIPQYAGEPTFLCLDLNIPVSGDQRSRFAYDGDEDCCYSHCGSAGRGNNNKSIMELCEHCPGRPLIKYDDNDYVKSNGTRTYQHTNISVLLLWTVWILKNAQKNYLNNLIKCLLVMCAISVRTTFLLTKKAWKSCS